MSISQQLVKTFLPKHWATAIENESRHWLITCGDCGWQISVWATGGIKFKGFKNIRNISYCWSCRKGDLQSDEILGASANPIYLSTPTMAPFETYELHEYARSMIRNVSHRVQRLSPGLDKISGQDMVEGLFLRLIDGRQLPASIEHIQTRTGLTSDLTKIIVDCVRYGISDRYTERKTRDVFDAIRWETEDLFQRTEKQYTAWLRDSISRRVKKGQIHSAWLKGDQSSCPACGQIYGLERRLVKAQHQAIVYVFLLALTYIVGLSVLLWVMKNKGLW